MDIHFQEEVLLWMVDFFVGFLFPLSAHSLWSVPLGPGSSAGRFRLPSSNPAVLLLLLNIRRTPAPAAKTLSLSACSSDGNMHITVDLGWENWRVSHNFR